MSFDGGYGVGFSIGDDELSGTPVYSSIAQVKTWNGIEIAQIMSEVTHHASTGGYREKVPSGLFEVSDIELGLAFDIALASHANAAGGLVHAMLNQTKLAYKITLPDTGGTNWTFDAYIQKINMGAPKEEHIMGTVTLVVTGQPVLA